MTNHTAAQPLDLDKLQRYSIEYDGAGYMRARSDGEYFKCDEVAALIAQARAAQPESATGTTGASIDTPEFRALVDTLLNAYWSPDPHVAALVAHIDAIIADLRAQLAAKGQGEPECGMCNDSGIVGFLPDQYEECPDCIKARAAAPASAQPDRGAAQEPVAHSRFGSPELQAMIVAHATQTDHGAAQGGWKIEKDGDTIRVSKAREGFAVLRRDGDDPRETVLFRYFDQTAPSPASQPVAPEPVYQLASLTFADCWHDVDRQTFLCAKMQGSDGIRTLYRAAVSPSDAKGKADERAMFDAALRVEHGENLTQEDMDACWSELPGYVWRQARKLESAKGEADAANAGEMMTLLRDAARAWNNEADSELDATMERIECFLLDSRSTAANAGGLLPCAFCGDGEPVLMPNEGPQGIGRSIGHPHTDTHYVHCDNCGADGPAHLTEYEARSAWNSRATQSPATSAADAKDAARYRVLREHVAPRDVSISMMATPSDIPPDQTIEERIDMLCDTEIERAAMAAAPSSEKGGDK